MVIRGLPFDQAAANAYCIIPSLHCPTPVIILRTSCDQAVKCDALVMESELTWISSARAGIPPRRKIGCLWLSSKLHLRIRIYESVAIKLKNVSENFCLPCKDGHGLLNIDGNISFPCLPAVVEEVVTSKNLLPSPSPKLNLPKIWGGSE